MLLKAILVDDEPLARSRIRELLASDDEVSIVGEARNGKEANKLIQERTPDLVFLDIQMPDYDGFSVLMKVQPELQPVVIFVTAYDQFAIRAFETNAIDYLLKPYDNGRFYRSLQSAKAQVKLKQFSKLSQGLLELVETYQWEQQEHPETIPIKHQGLIEEIPIQEILCVESHGNYVKIHVKNRRYLYRSTLSHLAEKFKKFNFLRIHRGVMINTLFVKKVGYQQNNEYRFLLENEQTYTSSRSYKTAIDAFVLARS